jgi:hypothetical protein
MYTFFIECHIDTTVVVPLGASFCLNILLDLALGIYLLATLMSILLCHFQSLASVP